MFENRIEEDYFKWLYNYVCKNRAHNDLSYGKLFMLLHDIEFTFTIDNDINRAKDGVDLRSRFALTLNEDPVYILKILDGPCSVLEMLVALAVRCEETIMDDTTYGDRTGQWFWGMLANMGISHMWNDAFDRKIAESRIYRFLDREYDPNGRGGLFYINDYPDDLRTVEIWTQLCWYLDKFA